MQLALKNQDDLEHLIDIKELEPTVQYQLGGLYALYQVARKLSIDKALGNSKKAS